MLLPIDLFFDPKIATTLNGEFFSLFAALINNSVESPSPTTITGTLSKPFETLILSLRILYINLGDATAKKETKNNSKGKDLGIFSSLIERNKAANINSVDANKLLVIEEIS